MVIFHSFLYVYQRVVDPLVYQTWQENPHHVHPMIRFQSCSLDLKKVQITDMACHFRTTHFWDLQIVSRPRVWRCTSRRHSNLLGDPARPDMFDATGGTMILRLTDPKWALSVNGINIVYGGFLRCGYPQII